MKRSLLLLIVLIVLLGIYWLMQANRPVVTTSRPFVPCDSASINSIQIQMATETVELAKQGEGWVLTKPVNYPAALKTVQAALGKFKEMEKLSMISDKPDRQGEFQVNLESGVKVTVSAGKKAYTFFLGKAGPTGQTTYARMDGSNEIWEIGGSQSGTFKRKAKDWRDKTITEYTSSDFQKFVLTYPDQTITATLQDTVWKVDAGRGQFDAEKSSVERLTNLLSHMAAVDFADTLTPNAFDTPALHLHAEFKTGQPLDLRLIPADPEAKQYFVRKNGASADFVIYKATADVLMKKADDFKAKAPEVTPKMKLKSAA